MGILSAETAVGNQSVRVSVSGGAVTQVELLPLRTRPQRGPAPKDALLKRALTEIREYLMRKRRRFTVPFKQSGTPFQQAVWKALLTVPYGRAVTYGTLAKMAGRPKASRAVGSAMNKNRLPLIVPCHRVVAGTGIGGFGCGVEWKKVLLGLEVA